MFSKQKVFCRVCGASFETTFQRYGGEVCRRSCWKELEWRRTLATLGKEYYPPSSRKIECYCGSKIQEVDNCEKCDIIN